MHRSACPVRIHSLIQPIVVSADLTALPPADEAHRAIGRYREKQPVLEHKDRAWKYSKRISHPSTLKVAGHAWPQLAGFSSGSVSRPGSVDAPFQAHSWLLPNLYCFELRLSGRSCAFSFQVMGDWGKERVHWCHSRLMLGLFFAWWIEPFCQRDLSKKWYAKFWKGPVFLMQRRKTSRCHYFC